MKVGLALRKGRFVWKWRAWWWWIPGQRLVVKAWNWVACQVWGHDDLLRHLLQSGQTPMGADDARCLSCCKRLDGCVGHDPERVRAD